MASVIRERDEAIFAAVGTRPRGSQVATPTADLADKIVPSFDPLWLHNGVYVFAPEGLRGYWLYATAGLSTPWHAPGPIAPGVGSAERSAVGYELSMATPKESDWPVRILNVLMLVSLGVWSGRIPGQLPNRGERIPLRPLGLRFPNTVIQGLITMHPPFSPESFLVRSGRVDWIHLLGITKQEYAWLAATDDVGAQQARIAEIGPVTDFSRDSAEWAAGVILEANLSRHFR